MAGVTYHIRVDGFSGRSGNIQLKISDPVRGWSNDHLAYASTLDGTDVLAIGSNIGTSVDRAEDNREKFLPNNGRTFYSHYSVWWTWTAPAIGRARIMYFNYEKPYHYVEVMRLVDPTMPVNHPNLTSHAFANYMISVGGETVSP